MKEEFDFESIKNKAIEQLKAGKPLLGKDGAFAPLLESILNAALEGEMDATFRCYQLRSVSGVLQAPSIEMEAEYTVLQVQPSDKVIDLFGDNPWAAGYQYLSVL